MTLTTRTRTRSHPAWPTVLLLAGVLISLIPGSVVAGPAGTPHLLLHARNVSTAEPCVPGIETCAAAQVSGSLYQPSGAGSYFVYLMAARFEPTAGTREVRVGLSYDLTTGSGVDVFQWHLCADSESPEAGWYQSGGANRITWSSEDCPTDSLLVGGYFYLTAYSAGHIALGAPAAGPAEFVNCAGSTVAVAGTELGYIGFGGLSGCNPCAAPCNYVSVEPTTWSGVKSLLRSRDR